MSQALTVLETMPTPDEFYTTFWNKRPFAVRSAISKDIIENLITEDELAGLAMEEGVQVRLVDTSGDLQQWSCRFGPFSEYELTSLPDKNWNLLVQNVEQFHPETATLLPCFHFAPRWMIDDIMVSLSAPGGSVGPHMDSYHVFLVQGQGSRRWKIGSEPIGSATLIDNPDLKILDTPIYGEEIEVACGDVLYIPPHFGHEGITLETAQTFSVGFLGPKLSELFGSYSLYLAELEAKDLRYVGAGLGPDSSGYEMSDTAVGGLRNGLSDHLSSLDFADWLVGFFSEPGVIDDSDEEEIETLNEDGFLLELSRGAKIYKPEYVKIALTSDNFGQVSLGFSGQTCRIDEEQLTLIKVLLQGNAIGIEQYPSLKTKHLLAFVFKLVNSQALEIVGA